MTLEQERAAQEAMSLKANDYLMGALADLRREATEALVRLDATEADKIRDAQSLARCIDSLMAKIEMAIAAGKPRKTSGVA